jgi:hypothetical protein
VGGSVEPAYRANWTSVGNGHMQKSGMGEL